MDFTKLDALVEDLPAKYGVPAADFLVYHDHRLVHRKSAGFSDAAKTRPVSDKDMYTLYSVSKTVTILAVARLIDKGLLKPDDLLSDYLPEFTHMRVLCEGGTRPAASPITIRELMTMSAGLTYNLNTPWIQQVQAEHPGCATTRQIMGAIAQEPLLFDPGTRYSYSLGHDVLAGVIEVITGETFAAWVQKNIFDPLDMKDATYHPTSEQEARLTAQYDMGGEPNHAKDVGQGNVYRLKSRLYESGGAGLYATAGDYMKFAACLAEGGTATNGYELVSRRTLDLIRDQAQVPPDAQATFSMHGLGYYRYGMGLRVMAAPGAYGQRTPKGEFGWDGAAAAWASFSPETGTAMFLGTQVLGAFFMHCDLHQQLRNAAYEGLGFPVQKD